PEYTVAAALAPLAVVALELLVLRTGLLRSARYWIATGIALGFQVPVDAWLTHPAHPVVLYRESEILGPRLVSFPIEDLGFGYALVTLTLLLWRAGLRHRAGPVSRPASAGRLTGLLQRIVAAEQVADLWGGGQRPDHEHRQRDHHQQPQRVVGQEEEVRDRAQQGQDDAGHPGPQRA